MSSNVPIVSLEYALSDWILNEYPFSVINGETIAKELFTLYKGKSYQKKRIARIRSSEPTIRAYNNIISTLITAGIISEIPDFHSVTSATYPFNGSYRIRSKPEYTSYEAACVIFPYSHISYLTAMDWHRFTEKNPRIIQLGTPSRTKWKKVGLAALTDFSLENISSFKKEVFLPKYPTKNKLFGMAVEPITDNDESAIHAVRGSAVRVTSPARTLVDMTRKPILCGGSQHAIDSFIEHAYPYRNQIIKYLESNGSKIDRTRVGFLMDKVMEIKDSIIDAWRSESSRTRGSSKVLVPGVAFSEYYDPDWSLSINLESLQKYGVN